MKIFVAILFARNNSIRTGSNHKFHRTKIVAISSPFSHLHYFPSPHKSKLQVNDRTHSSASRRKTWPWLAVGQHMIQTTVMSLLPPASKRYTKSILLPLNYPSSLAHKKKVLFRYVKNRHHQSAEPYIPNKEQTEEWASVKSQEWSASEKIFFIILLGYKSELMNRIIKMKMTIKSERKAEIKIIQ